MCCVSESLVGFALFVIYAVHICLVNFILFLSYIVLYIFLKVGA